MCRFLKFLGVISTCVVVTLLSTATVVWAQGVDPPDWEQVGVRLIEAIVPVLTAVFIWLARVLMSKIPRAFIPLVAVGLGVLVDWVLSLIAGGGFTPIIGALLGAAAVWLREFIHTLNEHGLSS